MIQFREIKNVFFGQSGVGGLSFFRPNLFVMTKFMKFNYENYRIMMNLFLKKPRKELFWTTICSASSSLSRLARFPRLVFCAGVFVVGGLDVEAWTLSSLNLPKPEPGGV